ncbi:MAG TPA: hypothetical protein VL354_10980, partial [Spirochaetia bacterium]|nr:hypothetical protein [Spirochaetia bacterium]
MTISPSILNARLKDLQEARLVERTLDGDTLTGLGRELFTLIEPLDAFSQKWVSALSPARPRATAEVTLFPRARSRASAPGQKGGAM